MLGGTQSRYVDTLYTKPEPIQVLQKVPYTNKGLSYLLSDMWL